MTITATSSAAKIATSIINLIALSDVFQTRIADRHNITKSEANARLHIYGGDVYNPNCELAELRPFAVVFSPEQSMEVVAQCSVPNYFPTGSILFGFEDAAQLTDCFEENSPDAYNDSWIDALNWIHGTLDDFDSIAVADEAFRPRLIEPVHPVSRPNVNDRSSDDFWIGMFSAQIREGS